MSDQALNYVSYLRLEDVLSAQQPRSTQPDGHFEHDEMLFIVIHQVYELWFKQMLHELDYLMPALRANDSDRALHTFRRLLAILKVAVRQIDILETMTPLEFVSFRDFLEESSGFQSVQFRELEFALGHKRRAMLAHFPPDLHGVAALETRYEEATLWDAYLHYLAAREHPVPRPLLTRDVTGAITPSPELQEVLVEVYRSDPTAARVSERMVDLDEGLQEWRYRHVKMVARTIGNKMGTGGSPGVKYLQTTVAPLYPDLWEIRSLL